jgi:hypothetical protein
MSAYETVINSLYEVKDWGRLETLQEVLKWLEENFFTGEIEGYYSDVPEHIVQGKFDSKEEMLQSFKERFNISEPGVYKVEVETLI